MVFEVKVGESAESLREKSRSRVGEKLKSDREARASKGDETPLTLDSDPGQLEAAIASGKFDLKTEYIDPKDGKIDEVKLEELVMKLTESTIHIESIPADVAEDMAPVIEAMAKDPEFAVQKDQLTEMLNKLRAVEAPRAEAEVEAKADITAIDVDSVPMPIEVGETVADSIEIEDILSRATELGYPQLEGVMALDIEDAESDIKNAREKLAKEHGMSDADLDKAAAGTLKVGFFGRFGGLLFRKTAHKNSLITKLREKSVLINDYARLEADATAKAVNAVRQERKGLPSMARRQEEQSRGVGIKGITK